MRRNGPIEIYQETRAQRDVLRAENLRLREALDNLAAWCPKQAAKRAQGCGVASQQHVEAREAARALLRELGRII